ncbi:MAG: SRPBCC family protein [Actinomycetota bacterium]|nr:SRPBCC family protein [Actinomycetota bacterium]
MIDIANQLSAIHRAVTAGEESVGVVLRRRYDADPSDVWDAITDPDRLKRWFLPVSGQLKVGGSFQLEGNAGGEILRCESPKLLRVTFGSADSVVELRITADGEVTVLELEHTVPLAMAGSGAGALYVGPGWDSALLALALFFAGEIGDDPKTAADSPEAQEFCQGSVAVWARIVRGSGTATDEEIDTATQVSLAQFAPDLVADKG